MNIIVVNKKTHEPTSSDIYIGRGSVLGNPYTSKEITKTKALYQCSNKKESIQKYKDYLLDKISNKDYDICNELNIIGNKAIDDDIYLVCYCVSEKNKSSCHGFIIKEIIEERIKNRNSISLY